jgi:prepilin signal peptidase PulO-like enzyme (type II secretory pathway)
MTCPQCQSVPMEFVPFLFFGWFRIICRHCRARLVLKSLGERFWRVLAVGAVAVAAIWLLFDYPLQMLGERWTLILFVTIIASTFLVAMYYAWTDSRFELVSHS